MYLLLGTFLKHVLSICLVCEKTEAVEHGGQGNAQIPWADLRYANCTTGNNEFKQFMMVTVPQKEYNL
jgi:hypothetical protein